jgi:DNA (cytosine-5)-methyltransferase 1
MGYHRAGFDVVGVDLNPQPRYPFPFFQADALAVLADPKLLSWDLADAIHASPPCQAHTTMSNRWRGKETHADTHLDLIPQTRELLEASGLPWVIENVPGARASMVNPITLHGGMFGLGVHRPRLFETSIQIAAPPAATSVKNPLGVYGRLDGRRLMTRKDGTEQRAPKHLWQAREAMGIDWMEWRELAESIPPAYTEYIGRQIIGLCEKRGAA